MDLKKKLARLRGAEPPRDETPAVTERLREGLKGRRRAPAPTAPAATVADSDAVEFVVDDDGGLTATRVFSEAHAHGAVPLGGALRATGRAVALLALDPSLAGFDPRRALFVDTETTGLAGGTGTIPFLIGMGGFEGERFVVTQHLVPEPGRERPALERLAARIEAASALVSFNGKSFDLPLLRTRFAMELMVAPPERPHLDLLHVARRIYQARVEQCRLTTLERDVLGFAREDDVASADVPALYQRFLRDGRQGPMRAVARHNVWDIAALAALVGELCARVEGVGAEGRFEPEDLLGVARTTWRAGDHTRALALADALAAQPAQDPSLLRDAHLLAAAAHRGQRDALARASRMREALALTPGDAALHLELARCYERDLGDPVSALAHAEQSRGAEPPARLARRIGRLKKRAREALAAHAQLRLPGM
jgi:uncharacterized protein YprB with RNaseH-like and TPR domain